MSPASHAITALHLEQFRNYAALQLALDPAPVVLRGANGAGKTNLLEAISLLAPGRGLRGARLREMDRGLGIRDQGAGIREARAIGAQEPVTGNSLVEVPEISPPWAVSARLVTREEPVQIGTGRDASTDARIIKINGERVRGHSALSRHCCIQWLTPAMDQVFTEGGTARRAFFDRIVYGFTPDHAARTTAYTQAMRERATLLTEDRGRADPYWLSVLEQQMAEHAVAITLAREETLARLVAELATDIAHFPRAQLDLAGMLETVLRQGIPALEAEAIFAERLKNERPIDAARGRCGIGPHRSEWRVHHCRHGREAAQCSTGEQKALMLAILLASARARAQGCGMPPILLLDEVIAHLDTRVRAQLFELIRASHIQAWMTGTDAGDFAAIAPYATVLTVADGTVG